MKSNLKLVENAVELPILKLTRSIAVVAEKKKRGRPRIMPIAVIEEPPPEPPAPPIEITKKKVGRPKKVII